MTEKPTPLEGDELENTPGFERNTFIDRERKSKAFPTGKTVITYNAHSNNSFRMHVHSTVSHGTNDEEFSIYERYSPRFYGPIFFAFQHFKQGGIR